MPPTTHTRLLPGISGLCLSVDSISRRSVRLYSNMLNSDNDKISFLAKKACQTKQSLIGGNLDFLRVRYKGAYSADIPNETMLTSVMYDDEDQANVQAIRDFLNGQLHKDFHEFIFDICTK